MKKTLCAGAVLGLGALLLGTASCGRHDPEPTAQVGTVYVELEPTVAGAPLVLRTNTYTTASGDQFTVSSFKFYLSHFTLQRADGTQFAAPDSYYLVDAADGASQHVALPNVPAGDYTRLSFTVGVDSARNVAGAQTGALDPVRGMFWDWNSGYIFVRLQGTSPQSPTGQLLFAIMGFQRPYNALRMVSVGLPGGPLTVHPNHQPEVHFSVDVGRMFSGVHPVRFSQVYDSEGGPSAVQVADNYAAGMFTLEHVHAN